MKEDIEYLKKYLHSGEDLSKAIKRLEQGEPVQYIVGDVNFYGNIIKVNNSVLIPRPETEELVEKTSILIKELFSDNINILDIGTGSGCISIALKKIFPNSIVEGIDISEEALEMAKDNATENNVEINFYQSDIFSNINKKYDCIISNPPYLKDGDYIMDIVKNNEPHLALYAEDKGLYFYKIILKEANKYLRERFIIALEIGENQKEDILKIAEQYFPNANIISDKDLRKLDRFIFIIQK
jgi:release factor glutamine methyltransferase